MKLKFNLNLEEHRKMYAARLYRLHWVLVQMAVLSELLDGMAVDAANYADNLYLVGERDDRYQCKRVKENIKFCRKAVESIQHKYLLDPGRIDAIYEVSDVIQDVVNLFGFDADLESDNINRVIKNYRNLLKALKRRNEDEERNIGAWKEYVERQIMQFNESKEV